MMRNLRENLEFGNDFYWLSQLYDESWTPGDTAV